MYDEQGNIIDRREMLKVKVKTLAAEARIIRSMAHRAAKPDHKLRLRHITDALTDTTLGENERWALVVERRLLKKRMQARGVIGRLRWELIHHRKTVLRKEARLTHIAYGLIRGRRYEQIEKSTRPEKKLKEADRKAIQRMLDTYGPLGESWLLPA